ncbi:MAG: hypothetical protein OXC82_13185 [Rhodobacteraceae bacterium]|nr:hypothetical protein [Paracoccaceae bacterium]MCY4251373.1 hypothetical protein [Paracoccaceae bacterium]
MTCFIAYIDEKEDERDNFFTDANQFGFKEEEIKLVDPEPWKDPEKLIEYLLEDHIDVLIIDYFLSEVAELNYSGKDLADHLLRLRPGFPCFVLTSFEVNAINDSSDVNLVYSKNSQYFERVKKQVQNYQTRIKGWEKKLLELLDVPISERTAPQIEKIVELDHLIENALGGENILSNRVKEVLWEDIKIRKDLIEKTEELIKEIKLKLESSK